MNSNKSKEDFERAIRAEIDGYEQTVQALKAVAHEMRWDDASRALTPNSQFWLGRRMDTTSANRVSPNNFVTPDLVVQLTGDFGIVAEAKIALSHNAAMREPRLLSLAKYDDDLKGWATPTKTVSTHNILLVVHLTRAVDVKEQLEALIRDKKLAFQRRFGVVGFAVIEQAQTWLSLKLEHGELSSQTKTAKLRRMVQLSLDHLAGTPQLIAMRLYDAKPHVSYMMSLIHDTIMSQLSEQEYANLRDSGVVETLISAVGLRDSLADDYGPGVTGERVPEIPRKQWVDEALEHFAYIGWARQSPTSADEFTYIVKKRRRPLDQFVALCAARAMDQESKKEAEVVEKRFAPYLFDPNPPHGDSAGGHKSPPTSDRETPSE